MARTRQQIRDALENCTVAPREAAAAVISDAAKGTPERSSYKQDDEDVHYESSPSWFKDAEDES
jgi:hypothetical protein